MYQKQIIPRPAHSSIFKARNNLMKHQLRQDKRVVATYSNQAEIEKGIVEDAKRMSFYRTSKPPVLVLGELPGMALWKIKVEFTTGVVQDFSYKTEPVND